MDKRRTVHAVHWTWDICFKVAPSINVCALGGTRDSPEYRQLFLVALVGQPGRPLRDTIFSADEATYVSRKARSTEYWSKFEWIRIDSSCRSYSCSKIEFSNKNMNPWNVRLKIRGFCYFSSRLAFLLLTPTPFQWMQSSAISILIDNCWVLTYSINLCNLQKRTNFGSIDI